MYYYLHICFGNLQPICSFFKDHQNDYNINKQPNKQQKSDEIRQKAPPADNRYLIRWLYPAK